MPSPREIDARFLHGPFRSSDFVAFGYSEKVLRGRRFRRLLPNVWVAAGHTLTEADRVEAAQLYLSDAARVTGITRIRRLGLDFGPSTPLHFVVDADLHIDLPGITLHRTAEMPPSDAFGVTPAAAFVAYAREARLIDAVAVGDWLLNNNHMSEGELGDLVRAQPWRQGAREVRYLEPLLVGRSRSIPESQLRLFLEAAGIEGLEVAADLARPDGRPLEIDLLATSCGLAIEYEGAHHQEERRQYLKDLSRYAAFREMRLPYKQVTKEAMRQPRMVVVDVYNELVATGYEGPAPQFESRWRALFLPVQECLRRYPDLFAHPELQR